MRMNWEELLEELNHSDATRQERALRSRLKERARQYALPKDSAATEDLDSYHVVTFRMGDELYALEVRAVRGVRSVEKITFVPSVPAFYRGVVNVRGQVISALDLRTFFNLPTIAASPREMLIVENNGLTLAVLADQVEDVMSIPRRDVEPVDLRYAFGVRRTADHITILDIEQITADERLIVGGKGAL